MLLAGAFPRPPGATPPAAVDADVDRGDETKDRDDQDRAGNLHVRILAWRPVATTSLVLEWLSESVAELV